MPDATVAECALRCGDELRMVRTEGVMRLVRQSPVGAVRAGAAAGALAGIVLTSAAGIVYLPQLPVGRSALPTSTATPDGGRATATTTPAFATATCGAVPTATSGPRPHEVVLRTCVVSETIRADNDVIAVKRHTYDWRGLLIRSEYDELGGEESDSVSSYGYDDVGRLSRLEIVGASPTDASLLRRWHYDARGRLTGWDDGEIGSPASILVTSMSYNEINQLERQRTVNQDGSRNVVEWKYTGLLLTEERADYDGDDVFEAVKDLRYADGRLEEYDLRYRGSVALVVRLYYDPVGNLVRADGYSGGGDSVDWQLAYTFNQDGWLTGGWRTTRGELEMEFTYEYDVVGRLVLDRTVAASGLRDEHQFWYTCE